MLRIFLICFLWMMLFSCLLGMEETFNSPQNCIEACHLDHQPKGQMRVHVFFPVSVESSKIDSSFQRPFQEIPVIPALKKGGFSISHNEKREENIDFQDLVLPKSIVLFSHGAKSTPLWHRMLLSHFVQTYHSYVFAPVHEGDTPVYQDPVVVYGSLGFRVKDNTCEHSSTF